MKISSNAAHDSKLRSINIGRRFGRRILSCGAELKNTFCVTDDDQVLISPHYGDLETLEAMERYENEINRLMKALNWKPDAVAYDMHPEYLSTKYALSLKDVKDKVAVQHHHAHIASCMADSREDGPVIGVAFDGTGYGLDGEMWGGEFLVAESGGFLRAAHLKPARLPGGAASIRQPWRMAAAWLFDSFDEDILKLDIPFAKIIDPGEWDILKRMIERGFNSPFTTSIGRLFDAVASIALLKKTVDYEAQAAIEFERAAGGRIDGAKSYKFDINRVEGAQSFGSLKSVQSFDTTLVIDPAPVIRGVVSDIQKGIGAGEIAARFHSTVAEALLKVCGEIREISGGLKTVALSGGVFQNRLLLAEASARLENAGFRVITHSRVPANDGGISLGQAVVADEILRSGLGEN